MADDGFLGGTSQETGPFLRVVKGDASDEEIAALVAAVSVAAAIRGGIETGQSPGTVQEYWTGKAWVTRPAVHPSSGGWRRSALPQ